MNQLLSQLQRTACTPRDSSLMDSTPRNSSSLGFDVGGGSSYHNQQQQQSHSQNLMLPPSGLPGSYNSSNNSNNNSSNGDTSSSHAAALGMMAEMLPGHGYDFDAVSMSSQDLQQRLVGGDGSGGSGSGGAANAASELLDPKCFEVGVSE